MRKRTAIEQPYYLTMPLFERARSELHGKSLTPPPLTNKIILDKEWSEKALHFLHSTRLGFSTELAWDSNNVRTEESDSDEETDGAFDVGDFK